MIVTFLACSEGAAVDQRSQNITLYNILDSMQAVAFPFIVPKLFISMTFAKEMDDRDGERVTVKASIGETEILQASFRTSFGGKNRSRFLSELPSLLVPAPGDLTLVVFKNQKELARWSIDVSRIEVAGTDIELENESPSE